MALHDGGRGVDIDHKTRQRVALAVDEAVAGRICAIRKAQRATHVVGYGNAVIPPRLVNLLLFEGEYTHGNRADLVVTLGDKLPATGIDLDQRAFAYLLLFFGFDMVDGTRENPGVTAQE